VVRNRITVAGLAVALTIAVACGRSGEAASKGGDGAAQGNGEGSGPGRGRGDDSGGTTGRTGGPGGPGGRGGGTGRGALSVVLGPNDVIELKRGAIESAVAIQGDLKPIEEIVVRARIEGNITNVYVREGDRVGRGQLLAQFESSTEESARKSAEADVESARADLANAKWNAEQSEELFKAGAIPERDLRTAQQDHIASQARFAAAESRLRAATQAFEDTRVTAPTTGMISTRTVEVGEHISRSATVFTVVRSDVLELEASVPSRLAAEVKPGLPVRFTAAGRDLTGRVARVSPTINPANRSLTVYLQVPNAGGALRGNTFATGRIVARTVQDALIVPTAAIRYQQTQAKPLVYRIVNEAVEFQPVDIGIVDEVLGIAEITSGLSEGDRVIVGNVGAIGRGVKVRIVSTEQQRSRPVPRP